MENNTYMRMYTWARKSVRRAYTCVDYILRKDPIRPTPGFTRWQDKGKKNQYSGFIASIYTIKMIKKRKSKLYHTVLLHIQPVDPKVQ